jgi:hypothetical protein
MSINTDQYPRLILQYIPMGVHSIVFVLFLTVDTLLYVNVHFLVTMYYGITFLTFLVHYFCEQNCPGGHNNVLETRKNILQNEIKFNTTE